MPTNMNKKAILLCAAFIAITAAKSQDASSKNFRFGLKAIPSFNWYKIDDEKTFTKGGASMKFGYGLITEFKLTDVAWFSSGLQVDYDGGKWTQADSIGYYYNENDGFLENNFDYVTDSATLKKYDVNLLQSRKYNSMYLTIPLQLRLKTKEIGTMTYYGNFGFNTSVHIKTRVNDVVDTWNSAGVKSTMAMDKLVNSKDMNFLKLALAIGFGAEMNLSGSTSLIFGLSYNQSFLNAVKSDSKYLIDGEKTRLSSSTKPTAQTQKFLGRSIAITLGVLF